MAPEDIMMMSIGAQYCIMDMVELGMFLEQVNEQTPLVLRRKGAYVLEKLPRAVHFQGGTVNQNIKNELEKLKFIQRACGQTFVVSELGAQHFEHSLKPPSKNVNASGQVTFGSSVTCLYAVGTDNNSERV